MQKIGLYINAYTAIIIVGLLCVALVLCSRIGYERDVAQSLAEDLIEERKTNEALAMEVKIIESSLAKIKKIVENQKTLIEGRKNHERY